MAYLVSQSGRLCAALYGRQLAASRNDNFYTEHRSAGSIYVREDKYFAALESGITPEVVIANELTGREHTSVSDLIENKELLTEEYDRQIRIRKNDMEDTNYEIMTDALREVMRIEVNRREQHNQDTTDNTNKLHTYQDVEQLHNDVRKVINSLVGAHMEPYGIVLRCLSVMYKGTHVPNIVDRLAQRDDGATPAAALLTDVIIEVVWEWVAAQIQVIQK